jgi:hypothetical protein
MCRGRTNRTSDRAARRSHQNGGGGHRVISLGAGIRIISLTWSAVHQFQPERGGAAADVDLAGHRHGQRGGMTAVETGLASTLYWSSRAAKRCAPWRSLAAPYRVLPASMQPWSVPARRLSPQPSGDRCGIPSTARFSTGRAGRHAEGGC